MDKDICLELRLSGKQGNVEEMMSKLEALVGAYGYELSIHGPLSKMRVLHYDQQKYIVEREIAGFVNNLRESDRTRKA